MFNYCFIRVSENLYWYLSWVLSLGLEDVARGMWWPDIRGYYVGAWGSCLFNNNVIVCL